MSYEARKERTITLLCAFAVPMLLLFAAFAVIGVYPFGDKSLLIVDMHNEYIDYLAQMNNSIRASGSFLRSWNMGMGLNMLGLIAFYTSSPFNLIVLILPAALITEAVLAVTLLKIGLCGLLFAVFARQTFPAASRVFHVAFAVAYALSAYNIAYSSNIMWIDGAAFLPLVILGVEKILRDGRYKIFLLSLVYVFFTSYYIGYMIGIFSFLYMTARYFTDNSDLKAYLRVLARFVGSAALAAGCCAFLLLPAFLNLRDGQSEMWNIPFDPGLKYPLARLAAKLLPGTYDSLTDAGLPNIYCTVLAATFALLYFCARAVPRREKLLFGGLFVFLIFSFSCGFLDLAWHAFESPTWFPARYSFVFIFLTLYLSLRCAVLLKKITCRDIAVAAGLLILLFIEIGTNRFWFVEMRQVLLGIALVYGYALVFAAVKKKNKRVFSMVLVFFVCMECFGNATALVIGLDDHFKYKSRSEYRDFMSNYGAAVKAMEALDTGIYRAEIVEQRGANGAMALGFKGISHYSTTTDQALNAFLRSLGYNIGTINELRFSPSTALTGGLLGVKYVFSKKDLGDAYRLRETVDGIGIYENLTAFPLAYWAPAGAAGFSPQGQKEPFGLQNEMIRALTGTSDNFFLSLEPPEEKVANVEKTLADGHIKYTRQIWNQKAAVEFGVENPGGREAFAYFPVYDRRFSSSNIFVNDVLIQRDLAYRANTIIPLGNSEKSTLKINMDRDIIRVSGQYFAALDLDAAKGAAQKAAAHRLEFTTFLDTVVEGRITAPGDGLLATTFPYDAGWTVMVDGKRAEPRRLAGVFLSVELEKGEHAIFMRYSPPGFKAGITVTLATVAGISWWYLRRKLNKKQSR